MAEPMIVFRNTTLHWLTISLLLLVFKAVPSYAFVQQPEKNDYVSYQLQWQLLTPILMQWMVKKKYQGTNLKALLRQHNKISNSDNLSSLNQTSNSTAYTKQAIAIAINALNSHNMGLAQKVLVNITPASDDDGDIVVILKSIISSRQNNILQSEKILSKIAIESKFYQLAQLSLAIVYLHDKQYEKSLTQISKIVESPSYIKLNETSKSYLVLIQSLSFGLSGELDRALRLLSTIRANTISYNLSLKIKAEILLNNKKYDLALAPLFEFSQRNNSSSDLDYVNIKVLTILKNLKQQQYSAVLRKKYLNALLVGYSTKIKTANTLSSQKYLNSALHRTIASSEIAFESTLNWYSLQLLEEIERNNSLQNSLLKSERDIVYYNKILKKGRKFWGKKVKEVSVRNSNTNKTKYSGQKNNVLLEKLLTDLVGVPKSNYSRYQLLDGLSIWLKGKAFEQRWWLVSNKAKEDKVPKKPQRIVTAPINIDFNKAAKSLRFLLGIPVKKRRLLLNAHFKKLVSNMNKLPKIIKKSVMKLKQQRKKLKRLLRGSLIQDADNLALPSENKILWLVRENMAVNQQVKSKNNQYRYYSENSSTGFKLKKSKITHVNTNLINTVKALKIIISKSRVSSVKNKAMFMLASLYVDSEHYITISKSKKDNRINNRLIKASTIYRDLLLEKNSGFKRFDIIYQLSRVYDLAGDLTQSRHYLELLSKKYPKHELHDEINFRRAEIDFSYGQYNSAVEIYSKIVNNKKSPLFNKAKYKLAWSYFKVAKYNLAVEQFHALLKTQKIKNNPKDEFSTELVRIMAIAFANVNGVNSIETYFKQHADDELQKLVLLSIADYYQKKSRYSDTVKSYTALLRWYPNEPQQHYYQSKIITSYKQAGFKSKLWRAMEMFISNFGGDSSYWAQADETNRNNIRVNLKRYLTKMAQRAHSRAQSSGHQKQYKEAIFWYKKYIRDLPNDTKIPDIYYLLAQAYREIKNYDAAVGAYQIAAYQFPVYSGRELAAYSALLVYQSKRRNQKIKSNEVEQLNDILKEIELERQYIDNFSDAAAIPQVKTRLAENLLMSKQEKLALAQSERLVTNIKLSATLEKINWLVIAQSGFLLKDFSLSEKAYYKLVNSNYNLKKNEIKIYQQRLAESIYKQAEIEQKKGDLERAIKHYRRLSLLSNDLVVIAKAEFDIATNQLALKKWKDVISTLIKFKKKFPRNKLSNNIYEKLVVAYENTGNWKKAAYNSNLIYLREKKTDLGKSALWRTAELYKKSSNLKKSYRYFKEYIAVFPKPENQALEARAQLVLLSSRLKNKKKERFWLNNIIKYHDSEMLKNSERSLYLASKSSLELALWHKIKLDSISLKLPLDKSIKRKQRAMRITIRYLQKALSYKLIDHSTQATLLMAQIYRSLAKEIMASPRPNKLSKIEMEQYEILLEDQTIPFEDKAIDLYSYNISKIKDGVYTPWVKKSLQALRQLMPARYVRPERIVGYYDSIQ